MTVDRAGDGWLSATRLGDWLLIAVLLAGAAMAQLHLVRAGTEGETAEVFVDGELRARIALDHPGSTEVAGRLGPVELVVEGGTIRVAAAPCPHKVCIRMGRKGAAGDTIVCVPSRLLVRITGTPVRRDIDAVTQ
jgi:hypothetical protein